MNCLYDSVKELRHESYSKWDVTQFEIERIKCRAKLWNAKTND